MTGGAKWTRLAAGVHVGELERATLLAVVGTEGVLVHGPAEPGDLVGLVDEGGVPVGVDRVTWATRPGLGAPLLVQEDDPVAGEAARVVASVFAVDLGGVYVEAVHPGRGATGADLVVSVPLADVVATGDLVRNPGPPGYGADCWPLEYPATLDMVLGAMTARTVVVPGRGPVVDREFVEDQRQEALAVAEQVDVLASRRVDPADAYAQGTWPYAEAELEQALPRALAQWVPRPPATHSH
ncbi:hypothetical protein [Solicola sp. PLA-1-18]|uniref:hypothetical protein n=1 Tax=Solicola sp. PLA-1-18 TaxID=3380532 RepID=UPI003B780112